jgi:hypothetical protein
VETAATHSETVVSNDAWGTDMGNKMAKPEAASVDEGRCSHAEIVRTRESKYGRDRAEAYAESRSDKSEGNSARCDAGGRSKAEKGIRALRAIRWRVRLTFDCGTLVPMTKDVMSQQTFCEFIVLRLAGVTI